MRMAYRRAILPGGARKSTVSARGSLDLAVARHRIDGSFLALPSTRKAAAMAPKHLPYASFPAVGVTIAARLLLAEPSVCLETEAESATVVRRPLVVRPTVCGWRQQLDPPRVAHGGLVRYSVAPMT